MIGRGALGLSALLLAGCGSDRAPWEGQDVGAVASWLYKLESPSRDQTWQCGSQWRRGGMAAVDVDDALECEALARRLARMMTEAGFGDVTEEEAAYPPLWEAFAGMRTNSYDPDALDGLFPAPTP